MKKLFGILVMIIMAGLLLTACTQTITEDMNGQTVNLKVGETVTIKLSGNPTTGYSWQLGDVDATMLKQAADLGCLQVRLTGGEPLMRPDFEEIYVYARRLGLKVWLFTSGRPITPRLADVFARIPPNPRPPPPPPAATARAPDPPPRPTSSPDPSSGGLPIDRRKS